MNNKLIIEIGSGTNFRKFWAKASSLKKCEIIFDIGKGRFNKGDIIPFLESDAKIAFTNHRDGDIFQSNGVEFTLHIQGNKAWLEVTVAPSYQFSLLPNSLSLALLYRSN